MFYWQEVPEEVEKILAMFMAGKAGPQRTLADLIMQKIQENDSAVRDTGILLIVLTSELSLLIGKIPWSFCDSY